MFFSTVFVWMKTDHVNFTVLLVELCLSLALTAFVIYFSVICTVHSESTSHNLLFVCSFPSKAK